MREETEPKLAEIFRAVLGLPAGTDVTGVQQQTVLAWDSLAHALLVAAIESEFGLSIDAGDSLGMTSYESIARYLEDRGL